MRQGNQHDEVDIFAYATKGLLDATMWQNNKRKARFIAAALSGDTSVRRLEDLSKGQANQFAMAKAIASSDQRLMQKAGLEVDIARLERLRTVHIDDQHAASNFAMSSGISSFAHGGSVKLAGVSSFLFRPPETPSQ